MATPTTIIWPIGYKYTYLVRKEGWYLLKILRKQLKPEIIQYMTTIPIHTHYSIYTHTLYTIPILYIQYNMTTIPIHTHYTQYQYTHTIHNTNTHTLQYIHTHTIHNTNTVYTIQYDYYTNTHTYTHTHTPILKHQYYSLLSKQCLLTLSPQSSWLGLSVLYHWVCQYTYTHTHTHITHIIHSYTHNTIHIIHTHIIHTMHTHYTHTQYTHNTIHTQYTHTHTILYTHYTHTIYTHTQYT